MGFKQQPTKPDFWKIQEELNAFRKEHKTFEKSIESRPEDNPYRFYDGPPFITGLPHYGSLLSSYCKDIIPRFWTMKGKRVERVRGWDCHGIPIESKVQKELGLANKNDIEAAGIDTFIQGCYKYTEANSAEWKWYVDACGRWVDFDNAYKTMDSDYMESVWWIFKQLYNKNMMYEGKRVSLYSTKLSTPISNFEVAMDNTYSEVNDPAITVKFDMEEVNAEGGNTYILAWTTTPWTIPANMALGVHTDIDYVKVSHQKDHYIVARARVEDVFNNKEYVIVDEFKGSDLVGRSYKPPFDYYYQKSTNSKHHTIVFADFATDESGTGIVHQAPEFGEDDFNLGKKEGIAITSAMDDLGRYTDEISDFTGVYYREANDLIMQKLADMGLLFAKASITHRVAFCPRSDVPLVYKAQNSWFVDIQNLKPKLLEKAEEINWYPGHFKHGRFAKSIETAPDWCISRTRYWGTPMPIYRPKDDEGLYSDEETLVIGSRDELFSLNKPYKQLTKVILLRHGRTDYNDLGFGDDMSQDKARLNDTGKHQAQLVAQKLKDVHIDAVYSSPMTRNAQTLEPLLEAKGLNVTVDERIREVDMPAFNGKTFSCSVWKWNDTPVDGEKGESTQQAYARVKEFLDEVVEKHAGETVVICSHGDPLLLMSKVFKDFDFEQERKKYYINNKDETAAPMKIEYVFSNTRESLDLHMPYVDSVRVQSPTSGKELYRIPEVLDCWFESGSMPYAQSHYPFENKEKMEASFPADYIVEYTGQIRAWFYLMHVMGVALFDKPAYKNVVCTGVMQGNDGRKMSKSYGNFPDPKKSFMQLGGDAIRMHSFNSPVVFGGDVAVKEEAFIENVKKILLPLWNAFYFFTTYANIDGFSMEKADHRRENLLDQWMMAELHQLVANVNNALESYEMHTGAKHIVKFLDNLTNRYIRRSRRRFWRSENDGDKMQAYTTLYHVLTTFCLVAAPYMPFITEYIYKELTGEESVHLAYYPQADSSLQRPELTEMMNTVQDVIRIGLAWRATHKIRVRQPLQSITIGVDLDPFFAEIVAEEMNVKQVLTDKNINNTVTKICKPNGRMIGPKYGKDVKMIIKEAKEGNFTENEDGSVDVAHFRLQPGEFSISYVKKDETLDVEVDNGIVVKVDGTITPELEQEGYARDLVRYIQEARKEAGYDIADRITIQLSSRHNELVENIVKNFGTYINDETLSSFADIEKADFTKNAMLGLYSVDIALKQ